MIFIHPSKKELSCYYDNEIIDIEKYEKITNHIENCPKCEKYINNLSFLSNLISKEDKEIYRNNLQLVNKSKIQNKWIKSIVAVAAVVLVVFSIFLLKQDNQDSDLIAYQKNQDTNLNLTMNWLMGDDISPVETFFYLIDENNSHNINTK